MYHHGSSHCCFSLPFEDYALKAEVFHIIHVVAKCEGNLSVEETLE